MNNIDKSIREANLVTEISNLCPQWIENILNKPYKEQINLAMDRVRFLSIEELQLDPKVQEEISQHNNKLGKINRKSIRISENNTALVQNFGNEVAYIQEWENSSKKILHAYYLDTQSGRAVDVMSIDPTIEYFATLTEPHELISDRWYADAVGRKVYYSGDADFGWISNQAKKEITNLIAPAHEIAHVLQHDVLRSQSPLAQFPIILKNWAESYRGTISSTYRLMKINSDLYPPEDVEMMKAAYQKLNNYEDDERGGSNERYAALFSLMFARKCRLNGVNLFRAKSQSEVILSTNDSLHSMTL